MNASKNVFQGDRLLFGSIDIDAPVRDSNEPHCHYYAGAYAGAAKEADSRGDPQVAATYRFIQALVSFFPSFDTPQQPYVPCFQMEGKRSLVPNDLTPDDLLALRGLAPLSTDPALRAQTLDVLWERTKDYTACAEAAEALIFAAEKLNTPEHWVHAAECFQRAMYLAAKLGRKKDLFRRASECLTDAVRASASDQEKFRCARFLRLIFQIGCGDPVEFATIAGAVAERASAAGNPHVARIYWETEADFQKAAKNSAAEMSARQAAAETYVIEAENCIQGELSNAMAAASLLARGIEALRRSRANPERIAALRSLLSQYQRDSVAEMKPYLHTGGYV